MNEYKPEGMLLHTPENREALSSLPALERAWERGQILEGIAVLCDADFSLQVDLGNGLRGVIPREPAQHSPSGEETQDIAILTRVGKPVCFQVYGFRKDAYGSTVPILSRRAAQLECAECYIRSLAPGDIVPAKVTHLESFGAFMDIGCGIVSLLSIDCISISRISHPKERFSVGDTVNTVIKSVDKDGRIYVSRRELLGTWEENAALFAPGQTVAGIVRSVESYGIFVELTPNLAGLAEWKPGIAPEETAAVFIKRILPEKMKIKLVIIDSHAAHLPRRPTPFAIDRPGGHMDEWRYSPEGCAKVIESKFQTTSCIS